MFSNRASGWQKTKDINEGGAQTKAEVKNDVQDKYERERLAQEEEARGRHGNNRDRGYNNNRDRDHKGGNYNDNRGGGGQKYVQKQKTQGDGQNQYKKKDTQGGPDMQKTKSQNERNNRNDRGDRKKNYDNDRRDIQPITDEELNESVKKTFKQYVAHKEREQNREEVEDDEEDQTKKDKPFDMSVFRKFTDVNGKPGSSVLFSLFQGVFDDEFEKVKRHLETFLKQVLHEKTFTARDFSDGVSKLIQNFGELALDFPLIHKYTFETIIQPLLKSKAMQYKFLKWIPPEAKEEKKEEDDEDFDLDNSDSQFKLMALIMNDQLTSYKNADLDKFMKENSFEEAIKKRREKLESADDVWETIESDVKDNSQVILSFLKE